jgi:molybdopterin synthase catalytic subunit
MNELKLSFDELQFDAIERHVRSKSQGAQVFFSGTPRDYKNDCKVLSLAFEAYEEMAISELEKIQLEAIERFDLHVALIHHRLGICAINQHAIIVGVGAPHRKEAFDACVWIMDEVKSKVPIWKKETMENGAEWVTPHP